MPTGIYKRTEEHKRKISEGNNGRVCSEETRKKISEAQKGIPRPYAINNPQIFKKGKKHTEEWKKMMSERLLKNPIKFWLGKKMTPEHRRTLSEAHKGAKAYNYKGGHRAENYIIRNSIDYRLWREAVFARDKYTCQFCGEQKIHKFEAHHIKNFTGYKELRFAIDNGIMFCKKCHKLFHRTYGYTKNNKYQINNFLKKDGK